jgi:hypothetical protein
VRVTSFGHGHGTAIVDFLTPGKGKRGNQCKRQQAHFILQNLNMPLLPEAGRILK